MKTKIKLKIADVIIEMQSKPGFKPLTGKEQRRDNERFSNFFYDGRQKPDISIEVEIVDKLPQINRAEHAFTAYHFQDGSERWHLFKRDDSYIFKCPFGEKKQLMLINKTFSKVTAHLLPNEEREKIWQMTDIIYDFLQVLLINYFALHKNGIFIHGIAVRDLDGKGLLFAGKSGCGKTTMAKLWYNNSKAMILNDDRVIARKDHKGNFLIYGTPWHGVFNDYLYSKIEPAPLEKLFFIYHSPRNVFGEISKKRAFNLLYPAIFPAFWDKGYLENSISFSQDLIMNVPCHRLGFVNNKSVIAFVRKAAL